MSEAEDRNALLAGLYGLLLRQCGYSTDKAAALVIERYPTTQPVLEKLARPPVMDPLSAEERHLSAFLGPQARLGGLE